VALSFFSTIVGDPAGSQLSIVIGIKAMKSDIIDATLLIGLASVFFAVIGVIGYLNSA
jgi:hypothetical protein